MLLNVLMWGNAPSNPDGLPTDWPYQVFEVPDGPPAPAMP